LLRTWPSKLPPMKSGAMILCNVATSPFASAASQSLSNCATCSSGFVERLWANPHNAVPRHTNAGKTARLTEIMSAPLSTADRHRRWSECSRLFRANTCLRKQRLVLRCVTARRTFNPSPSHLPGRGTTVESSMKSRSAPAGLGSLTAGDPGNR